MKRILLVALVACLCLTLTSTALAGGCGGYTETYTVFMPQCTETVTTTYGTYQQVTYEYGPTCGAPPCDPCAPPPCQPPCQPQKPCAEKIAIEVACDNIKDFTLDVLSQLDRELEGSGWVRIKDSKRKLLKSGRCIYTVTVKNQETGEKISCFLVVRTADNVVQKLMRERLERHDAPCCARGRKCHKHCFNYTVMFVWNYNTGCNAAVYEDEWYITDPGLSDGEAVVQFVNLLVTDEIERW